MTANASPHVVRFGDFEVDLRSGELRKRGMRIALQGRALQVLEVLLGSPGELVTRETLRQKLWGGETFVDFETGLNAAVRRLREALGDAAGVPRFVETLPRRGYRFIMPLQGARQSPAVQSSASPLRLAVLPFVNLTGDAGRDYLADGLAEETTVTLARVDPVGIVVIGRTSMMRYKGTTRSLSEIGARARRRLPGRELESAWSRIGCASPLRWCGRATRIRVWTGSIRARADQRAGAADGARGGDRGADRAVPVAAAPRSVRAQPDRQPCGLRPVSSRPVHAPPPEPGVQCRCDSSFRRSRCPRPDFALAWSALADVYANSGLNGDATPACHRDRSLARQPTTPSPPIHASPTLRWPSRASGSGSTGTGPLPPPRSIGPSRSTRHTPQRSVHAGRSLLQPRTARRRALAASERGVELDPLNPLQHAVASEVAFRRREYRGRRHPRTAIARPGCRPVGRAHPRGPGVRADGRGPGVPSRC